MSQTVGPPHLRSPRLWQLAGIEAAAFSGTAQTREQWPVFPRVCVRMTSLAALLISERRVDEGGRALCMLIRRTKAAAVRGALILACLMLTICLVVLATAALWWPLPWALTFLMLALLAPCAASGWRNRAPKRQLAAATLDRQAAVFMHSLARIPDESARGAGAHLVRYLVAEADREGWTLVLDAGAPGLADYYARFGFERVGVPVGMTWGDVVRMVREPVGARA